MHQHIPENNYCLNKDQHYCKNEIINKSLKVEMILFFKLPSLFLTS